MKSFVIIGMGRFGENLANTLYRLGHEVLAIDERDDRIQQVSEFVTHAVCGNILDEHVLRSLGVRNFDCVIVSLSGDMGASVLVTLMLKELGVGYVVARATSDLHRRVLEKVGADRVVFPEQDMGTRLAQSLAAANILDYIELSGEYSIVEMLVPDKWKDKSLADLNVRARFGVNVVAIKSEDDSIDVSPDPNKPLKKEDTLVIIGANDDLSSIK